MLAGTATQLKVDAQASAPIAYQWRKNGVIIPNATTATLTFAATAPADSGSYDVTFTVAGNTFSSATAQVIITTGNEVAVSSII